MKNLMINVVIALAMSGLCSNAHAQSLSVDTSQVSGAFYLDYEGVSTPIGGIFYHDPQLAQLINQSTCAPTSDQVIAGIGALRDYHQFKNHHFFTPRGQTQTNYATLAPGAALTVEANLCSSSGLVAEQVCGEFQYKTLKRNPQTAIYVSSDPNGQPAVIVYQREDVTKTEIWRWEKVCFRNRGAGQYKLSLKNTSSSELQLIRSSSSVGSGFLFNY